MCIYIYEYPHTYVYIYHHKHMYMFVKYLRSECSSITQISPKRNCLRMHPCLCTGWQRPIGCLKLQAIFRKRANNYRALLRKMTNIDKASYDSTAPCKCMYITNKREYLNISLLYTIFQSLKFGATEIVPAFICKSAW